MAKTYIDYIQHRPMAAFSDVEGRPFYITDCLYARNYIWTIWYTVRLLATWLQIYAVCLICRPDDV